MPNAIQGLLPDLRGEMRATQRKNKFMGILADALTAANDYAQRPDATMPGGLANPVLGMLADAVALPSMATTAQRVSYGEPLTNGLRGSKPFLKPETADVAMMAPISPRNALAALGMVGGMADNGAMRALGPVINANSEKAARMAQMGLEGGWYRGGPAPVNNLRTGPWYTRDLNEAAAYAKRFENNGDVREYAIPSAGYLKADASYSSKLVHDLAKLLDDPYFGKPGAQLAKEFRTFGPEERISGASVWQALESRYGNDGAAEILTKLGAFKGVKGIAGPNEAYVFKNGAVRDAQRAEFDPSKYNVDNILAGITGIGVLGGTAAADLLRKPSQD